MPRKTLQPAAQRLFLDRIASMRPRPDAAENIRMMRATLPPIGRFNEAAARCRGKHGRRSRGTSWPTCGFNEAAARCRGKRAKGGTALTDAMKLQ